MNRPFPVRVQLLSRFVLAALLVGGISACAGEPVEDGTQDSVASAADAAQDAGQTPEDAGPAYVDDSATAADSLADADPAPDSASPGECDDGARKCSDKSPYSYNECKGSQWESQICPGSNVCNEGKCVAAACPVGQKYCDGVVARKCNDDGLASAVIEDCGQVNKTCVDGECQLEPCTVGTIKCVGNAVAKCNPDGKGFALTPCLNGKVCDGGACKSTVCFDGEVHCDGAKVIKCNAKKTAFEQTVDCAASGQSCCNGQCGKPVCTPKTSKCDDDTVVSCGACGMKWGTPEDCKSKGQTCKNAKCVALVCTPNANACKGNNIARKCDADGLKWVDQTCVKGEYCIKGACLNPTCELQAKWSSHTQGFTAWAVATKTADACDLDGDGKKDNAFGGSIGPFAAQINNGLAAQVNGGNGVFLLEAPKFVTDGSKFNIDVINGNVDISKGACSPASQSCEYKAFVSSYDLGSKAKTCPAKTLLEGATVANGKLTSLGPVGKPFKVVLPLGTGADLELDFHKMRVVGDVKGTTSWQSTSNGRLCGAIRKDQLIAEIGKVPDWFFAQQGLSKAAVTALLNALLKLDFDTTGDGKKDAASASLTFTTTGVKITGF